MNFSMFCSLNADKFPMREFLIERHPSKGIRRTITWGEFNDQANKLAQFMIKECGIKKGDIVLHLMMNSIEWYVTYMAILKTGATITPLNFRFATADIKYAADVVRSKVFMLDDTFVPKVEPVIKDLSYVNRYVCVGNNIPSSMTSYKEIIDKGDRSEVMVETADDEMAELMFTSGTTGAPKPVCHAHKTLFYIGMGNALTFGEGYETVNIAPHPFYHSGSLFYSFPCYMAAGRVLIAQDLAPQGLIQSIAEEKATGGWISVPIWSDIINMIKSGAMDISGYDFSNLTYIATGAQPVPTVLLEDSKKIFPKLKMFNSYGITEGGGGGTVALYDEDLFRKPGAIGKPTAFMEVKIVDNDGNTQPPGKVGELLLRGPRLMKEYAYNPEMTARTITNGWLHTGDLAYTDEEGFIFFADRSKDLIIRGGENIFPAEIEDILRKNPKIQDVAVIGYPHPRFVEITMAIVQLKQGETMKEEEVIEFCKEKGLAKYKWPEKIVYADVPRNPAGKIEKPKLRDLYVKPVKEEVGK